MCTNPGMEPPVCHVMAYCLCCIIILHSHVLYQVEVLLEEADQIDPAGAALLKGIRAAPQQPELPRLAAMLPAARQLVVLVEKRNVSRAWGVQQPWVCSRRLGGTRQMCSLGHHKAGTAWWRRGRLISVRCICVASLGDVAVWWQQAPLCLHHVTSMTPLTLHSTVTMHMLVCMTPRAQVVPRLCASLPVFINSATWEETAEELDDIFLGDAEIW